MITAQGMYMTASMNGQDIQVRRIRLAGVGWGQILHILSSQKEKGVVGAIMSSLE